MFNCYMWKFLERLHGSSYWEVHPNFFGWYGWRRNSRVHGKKLHQLNSQRDRAEKRPTPLLTGWKLGQSLQRHMSSWGSLPRVRQSIPWLSSTHVSLGSWSLVRHLLYLQTLMSLLEFLHSFYGCLTKLYGLYVTLPVSMLHVSQPFFRSTC